MISITIGHGGGLIDRTFGHGGGLIDRTLLTDYFIDRIFIVGVA